MNMHAPVRRHPICVHIRSKFKALGLRGALKQLKSISVTDQQIDSLGKVLRTLACLKKEFLPEYQMDMKKADSCTGRCGCRFDS